MDKLTERLSIREGNERAILAAAESVFAEQGFGGATMAEIAARAGVPKPNVHYYFPTKAKLYRAVIEQVLTAWLDAASSFDASADPAEALTAYIETKMDLAREMPLSSRIWANEIMRGAPVIQDFLDTTLAQWVRYARGGGAALDRRGQVEADRTQIPLLHDLGDDPALCQCRTRNRHAGGRPAAGRSGLRARQETGCRHHTRRCGG